MPRLLRLFAASLAVSVLHVWTPSTGNAADKPPYTLEERAEAISRPALLFFETRVEGSLRYKENNELVSDEKIIVNMRCSGFLVSSTGHAVTAAHCVKPDSWVEAAGGVLADLFIERQVISANQRESQIGYFVVATKFVGSTPDSAATVKIMAQQNALREGEASTPVEVVAADNEADVAVVKLGIGGLPMAEIGAARNVEDQLVQIGYSLQGDAGSERRFTPSSKPARIGALPTHPSGPSKLDSELGAFAAGGMVVNHTGQVVGMINVARDEKNRPSRQMVPSAAVTSVLTAAGVSNETGATDKAYRQALDAYFGGKYTEAIKQFDDVLRRVPDHQMAADYKQRAQDRLAIEGDPGNGALLYVVAGAGGATVLLLVIGIPFLIISRRRRRREEALWQASASPYGSPISGVPISVQPLGVDGSYSTGIQQGTYQFPPAPGGEPTIYYGQQLQPGDPGAGTWPQGPEPGQR